MPRIAKLSKAEISDRLMGVFVHSGYEGASLKMLAEAVMLSKASLYHHFPKGKEDMAAHVLGQSGVRLQSLVLAPLMSGRSAVSRRDSLIASLDGTALYYSGAVPMCLMNSLLLGGGQALFGDQINKTVSVWQQGLEKGLSSAGADRSDAAAWGAYAIERIQGSLILCRVRGMRVPLENCLSELKADVTEFSR